MNGDWFRVSSGDRAGEVHMASWMMTAVRLVDDGGPTYVRMNGWMALAICPRCAAVVLADRNHAYGDQTIAHEQWHAATDWPIPAELRQTSLPADEEVRS